MRSAAAARERRLGRCIFAGILWLGLHLFVAVENFKDSLYVTFDSRNYVWIAVYTAVLLLLDVLLFFLNSPGAAKKWLRYWTFCTAICVVLFLGQRCQVPVGSWLGLWAIFPLAATPLLHYAPLWLLIGNIWGLGCTALLCGAHMIYFLRLMRRGSREEDHGALGV